MRMCDKEKETAISDAEREEIARSLLGIIPDDITLQEAMEERAKKISGKA